MKTSYVKKEQVLDLADEVMNSIEDKLNDMVDSLQREFPDEFYAKEIAVSCAGLCAQFAQATGTSKMDFITLMMAIYDEYDIREEDVSQMN